MSFDFVMSSGFLLCVLVLIMVALTRLVRYGGGEAKSLHDFFKKHRTAIEGQHCAVVQLAVMEHCVRCDASFVHCRAMHSS